MDVAALEPGRDFRKAIDAGVAACNVFLAIIGRHWLDLKDAQGQRRLDDPNDFVRIELESALRRDIPVVPVLVQASRMPQAAQLPESLKELAYRNAVELTHARWKSDVQLLLRALRPHLDLQPRNAPALLKLEDPAKPAEPASESVAPTAIHGRSAFAPDASTIEPQAIERLGADLALYIGPISPIVVKRLVRRCSSLEELYTIAAREIESEIDRRNFLRSRPA